MAFKKGQKKIGGRKAGTPNKATQGIKDLLAEVFDDEEVKRRWLFFLNHKDQNIRWKAWDSYNDRRFGKPALPIVGSEEAPSINLNISALPFKRKRV